MKKPTSKKNSGRASLCNNIFTKNNKTLENACKKVETKLKNKQFRRKIILGSALFLLFNLAIILILSRKNIAYKLIKYFVKKVLDGAGPEEKEMIYKIQTNLPLVVNFVNKHSDTIKKVDNTYTYYSGMYNDFVNTVIDPDKKTEYIMPGSFPSNTTEYIIPGSFPVNTAEQVISFPDKKLNQIEAEQLIDDLIEEKNFFYFF